MAYKLHVVEMPLYAVYTSVYILETLSELFIIDSGVGSGRDLMDEALERSGAKSKRVTLLCTHDHWDHNGLNSYLREQGAFIAAHELCRKPFEGGKDLIWQSGYEMFLADFPQTEEKRASVYKLSTEPCSADMYFLGGERFVGDGVELEVIHTPGHVPSAVCFYEHRTGALFSGDSLQGRGYYGNAPQINDAAAYEKSLKKLEAYEITAVYGAHDKAIGANAAKEYLACSADTLRKAEAAVIEAFCALDRKSCRIGDIAARMAGVLGVPPDRLPAYVLADALMRKYLRGL